jgi:lipopolysaccharide export system protein LptA
VPSHSSSIGRITQGASTIAFALAMIAAGDAGAQSVVTGLPNAMQGFSQNRNQPVRIEAAAFEIRDKNKQATFSGHVKVLQGDTTMTSRTLVAFYDRTSTSPGAAKAKGKSAPVRSATPGPSGSSSIHRLEARGNVVVAQKDQVVTGETAVLDTRTNMITMLGGVLLTQCKSVLRGDRLLVDMSTGVSRVESYAGKVQALIPQSGSGCAVAPPAPESARP